MGLPGSKHAKRKKHTTATISGRKHLTTSTNDKLCQSRLRRKRDDKHLVDQLEKNSKDTRNNNEKRKKKWEKSQKKAKVLDKTERIKPQLNKTSGTISTERSRKAGKVSKSHTSMEKSSEIHSTISSTATVYRKPNVQLKKYQSKQRGNVAAVKSLRKAMHSLREIPARSSSSSSRQSLRSVRNRIKALFSRPMRVTTVQKFVEKIKKRDEMRKGSTFKEKLPEIPLRSADEKFPLKRKLETYELEMKEENDGNPSLKKPTLRVSNKDNEGKLFDEDGLPFWNKFSKVQKDDGRINEEVTDDSLPMDSEVLLEVQAGLRKLVKMPKIRIVMDPYAPLDYLKSRDETFFTAEVIFSNTIRSMVNLNDEISNKEIISKRSRELGKILIEEPIKITVYDQNNPLINEQIPISEISV